MDKYKKAIRYAELAHKGQVRKYTEEPYFNHCLNVSHSVRVFTDDVDVTCAALLHDTIEDTDTTYIGLCSAFNERIAKLVFELTDRYTKERCPELNRKERKFLEACRLKDISKEAKLIKYFDIMDNSSTIFKHDARFAKTYLKEKQFILSYSLSDLEF